MNDAWGRPGKGHLRLGPKSDHFNYAGHNSAAETNLDIECERRV